MASDFAAASREILQFLTPSSPLPPKLKALEYFVGVSASPEGCDLVSGANDGAIVRAVLGLVFADKQPPVVEHSFDLLVNITVDEDRAWILLNLPDHIDLPRRFLDALLDRQYVFADRAAGVLCNATRSVRCAARVAEVILKADDSDALLRDLVTALTTEKYNEFASLHLVAPLLSNLTQVKAIRRFVMDEERLVFQRLLSFIDYDKSLERRGGVVGIIRNCCFDVEKHEWLLGDDVDLLPRLLLPLAGPEEFDEEENDKLPEDLQYLPDNKKRESDPDLRKMLVETVFKLCDKASCRQFVRSKNSYVIMRELHKWEKDRAVDLAIQKLVDLLIADDDGRDMDKVVIPEDLEKQLELQDQADEKWVREGDEEEEEQSMEALL